MAAPFHPSTPYTTRLFVLTPEIRKVAGARAKVPTDLSTGFPINCSFKTYGGTETTVDGIYAIEDTATVETWYRPDIKSGCVLAFPETGAFYEIVGEPEDVNQRHQFMRLKVKRFKGGV